MTGGWNGSGHVTERHRREPRRFQRALWLGQRGPNAVVGWLEDDFHHFGVTIEHEGGHVRAARAATVRYPWSTCAEAGIPLARLAGLPLVTRPSDLSTVVPMEQHCTHVFELAALALVHAAAGRADRRYDATVEPAKGQDCETGCDMSATLDVDGARALEWIIRDSVIIGPGFGDGLSLTKGFRQWIDTLDDEAAERAWVLRRAAWLAFGDRNFQQKAVAADVGIGPVCHTFQPAQRNRALSMDGSRRPDRMADAPLLSHRHETP